MMWSEPKTKQLLDGWYYEWAEWIPTPASSRVFTIKHFGPFPTQREAIGACCKHQLYGQPEISGEARPETPERMSAPRLTRDIVIPEGTKLSPTPVRVDRIAPFLSALVPLTRDVTAELIISRADAVALGLVTA